MKKYLITGAMALLAGFYLTSCTHDDIEYSSLYEEKTQNFEKVFKDLYGTIDPNHDWGFTPYVLDGITTTNGTRALTRGHDARANMWAGEWVVPNALTNDQKDKVRRWFQQHQNPEGVAFSHKDFFVQQVYKGGDNTTNSQSPEKYTAANGDLITGSNKMDLLTCGSYSEGASTEYNSGRNFYDHINNFNNGTYSGGGTVNVLNNGQPINGGSTHPDQIMLMVDSKSDCFGYWNSNGSVGYNDKYVIIPGDVIQEWDSNGGSDANVSGMYFVGLDYDQRVESAYSDQWYTGPDGNKYRYLKADMNQYCGAKEEYNNVPSNETIQGLLDQGYLPVAGKADKVFVKITSCADGYYSDWIVRVIPGTKKSSGGDKEKEVEETTTSNKYTAKRHQIVAMGRIFVEDLYNATRADIDYNDAVYDAIIWHDYDVQVDGENITAVEGGESKFRVEIALLAAGGTIPLKIAGNKFGDVHEAFGVGMTTIVNTVGEASNVFGSLVTGKDYVYKEFDYTDEINALGKNTISINDIPVQVLWPSENGSVAATLNNTDTHTYMTDEDGKLVTDANGAPIIVESGAPVVPHMLQVEIGTEWPQERVNIGLEDEGPYHDFPAYVSDYTNHPIFWENNVDRFYLYADNRTPLAYSDKYVGYAYLTDIETSVEMEGVILSNWQTENGNTAPVDLGTNFNANVIITPQNLFSNAGLAVGDVIRLYCSKKAEGDFNLKVFGGHWENYVPINGWSYDGEGTISSSSAKEVFNTNGYIEIPITTDNIAAFTTISNWGGAIILQGHNLNLEGISIIKAQ